jgi:integrase
MQNWGKVVYMKHQGAWGVRGKWQGKRIYFSEYRTEIGFRTCQTEEEARILRMVISSEIANGTFNPLRYRKSRPLHIRGYAAAWLNMVRPNIAHGTYKAYRAAILNHIVPKLGDVFLPDLNYEAILNWVNSLPLDVKTKKNYHGVLAEMLRDAVKSGHISQLPSLVQFKHGLSVPQKTPDWIDADTQQKIISKIPEADRPIFHFMMITGIRPSEARALQRRDIYRDKGYIIIRHTFAPNGQKGEAIKTVKQKKERRIPFYLELAPIFDSMPIQLHTEFVFINSKTGTPYSKNINRDHWNPACKKALGYIVPLNVATRHSFGQRMAEQYGVETASALLGHSTTAVTKRHYVDAAEAALKKIGNK